MEVVSPRQKNCKLTKNLPLPIIQKKDGQIKRIKAYFNGFSVIIEDSDDMKNIISMGYFGKANFSRSYPHLNEKETEILRIRQFERRKDWSDKCKGEFIKKVIVVPDSEDENEEYFINLRPEYQIDHSGIKETVWIGLEEAFYLQQAVNCLDVYYDNKLLESQELWKTFLESDPYFPYNYVVYFYYRAKNWVVKPGIKFGGDYLLYQQGPPFYHASYVIIIDYLNWDLKRIETLSRRSMDNTLLIALNRLCETAGKELLICQVILPIEDIDYSNLTNITIREILMKRWLYTQETI